MLCLGVFIPRHAEGSNDQLVGIQRLSRLLLYVNVFVRFGSVHLLFPEFWGDLFMQATDSGACLILGSGSTLSYIMVVTTSLR